MNKSQHGKQYFNNAHTAICLPHTTGHNYLTHIDDCVSYTISRWVIPRKDSGSRRINEIDLVMGETSDMLLPCYRSQISQTHWIWDVKACISNSLTYGYLNKIFNIYHIKFCHAFPFGRNVSFSHKQPRNLFLDDKLITFWIIMASRWL